jgi:hypothetical protein
MGPSLNSQSEFAISLRMDSDLDHHGSKLGPAKRVYGPPAQGGSANSLRDR